MREKFRIHAMRTVKSPSDPSVTSYYVWVNMRDLPDNIPTEVNPRETNMRTATAKKLLDAVSGPDPYFDIHNRGIVILAQGVHFDSSNSMLELDLGDDRNRYGILDGGHTYRAIKERRDLIPADIDKYVKLEVFVGNDLDVAALSDARNTSVQVSDIALFNLEDRFGFIKDAIAGEPYADKIAYKDNEDKPVPVAELLRLMFAFNIDRFPDASNVPISAYSGKANVFKDYKKEWESHSQGDEPTADNIYLKLTGELPRLVKLYETIQKEIGRKYKEYKADAGTGSSFGRVRGVESGGKYHTEFTGERMDYDVSNGFIMPIYGAFRALLSANGDGALVWSFDPLDMWDSLGKALVQNTFDTDTNPQMAGKSKTLWQANYRIVENEKNKQLLERLMAQGSL